MSNFIFILGLGILLFSAYIYTNKKWKKREKEFDDYAYKMQKDFLDNSPALDKGLDYYKLVQDFYTNKGYSLSKHPSFATDFIAKKDKDIMFIRVQGPQDKKDITAQVLQNFVGQTVLQVIDDKEHQVSWVYVCSKMMCDKSAKIYMKSYENKVNFELIEV